MKKSRFTDEQIIGFLKQVEAGATVKELGRNHVSDASFYKWRSRFGGMDVADARRLRELEGENGKLKKLLAPRRCWTLSRSRSSRGENGKPAGAARGGAGDAGEDGDLGAPGVRPDGVLAHGAAL
jgi:putative transposase